MLWRSSHFHFLNFLTVHHCTALNLRKQLWESFANGNEKNFAMLFKHFLSFSSRHRSGYLNTRPPSCICFMFSHCPPQIAFVIFLFFFLTTSFWWRLRFQFFFYPHERSGFAPIEKIKTSPIYCDHFSHIPILTTKYSRGWFRERTK